MSLRDVTGEQLADALTAAGWQVIGGRIDGHTQFAFGPDTARRPAVVVPLDRDNPEYEELMGAALNGLERLWLDGSAARRVLRRLDPEQYR